MSSAWDLIVEVGFPNAPFEGQTFTNLAAGGNRARSLRFRHGKGKRYDPLDPAECVLVLDNRNGKLDPNWSGGPYFPNVRRDKIVRVTLDSKDTGNLLGVDQAAFESRTLTGWENNVGAAVTISDIQHGEGERALRVEATATGRVSARTTGIGTAGFPVTANTLYTIQAAAVVGSGPDHQLRFAAQFYDSAGAVLNATFGGGLRARAGIVSYETAHDSFTTPATAAFARIIIDVHTTAVGNEGAVGNVTFLRRVSLSKGTYKPWERPGGLYPIIRGPALSWTARYDRSLNDATCELVVHDLSRALATHKLWPALFEHDLLDGHAGPPPVSYYPLDERANQHGVSDVIDRVGGRPADTTNDVRAGASNVLQWDVRPFKGFGGGSGQGAQTMFVQSLSSQELDGPWSIDLMFRLERVGAPVQTIFGTTDDKLRLFVWEDSRLNFEVIYTDGTSAKVTTSFALTPGPIEHCTLTCEADGTIELWLNRVFRGFAGGGGKIPAWWGTDLICGADRFGGAGMAGEMGRLALYNYRRVQGQIEALNDAIKFPWGFHAECGDRMKFLLQEFRHRKDNAGTTIAGTFPGIPTFLVDIDQPSNVPVQDMYPAERSVLEYMRALERTEGGYLKVKQSGAVRFRRRDLVLTPRAGGIRYDNDLSNPTWTPYMNASVGRTDDVISTVTYSTTGKDSNRTVEDQRAVSAFGEVDHTMTTEADTPALAQQAAEDALFASSWVPPMPSATVTLRPDDPRVGWYAALVEPGSPVRLLAQLPQYLHQQGYEVLSVEHNATPGAGWITQLELVGNP